MKARLLAAAATAFAAAATPAFAVTVADGIDPIVGQLAAYEGGPND